MRKELLIFGGGAVIGVVATALWFGLSATPRGSGKVGTTMSHEPSPAQRDSTPPVLARVEQAPAAEIAVPSSVPSQAANEAQPPANTPAGTDPTVFIPEQYLDVRLQGALQRYRTAGDRDDREKIVDEVVVLPDSGISKTAVASTLGLMFRDETSTELKTTVLNELGNLDDPSAFPQLAPAADASQPEEVRVAAISAMEDLGDQRAVPLLKQLLSDGDREIRQAAQDALDTLTAH